jgi:ligand-binding SRPBCC domain-containing protein
MRVRTSREVVGPGLREPGWAFVCTARGSDPDGSCCEANLDSGVRSIRLETIILAPIGDCFELSLSVAAHPASMGSSGERAVAGVTSGALKLGDTVTWQARHLGIRFSMTSAITEYDYPRRFVDEQQRGPFQRWWHEHTFTEEDSRRTLMVDAVRFRSPLGPLGDLADRLVLERYMAHLLRQRNTWLKQALEARG